MFFHRSPTSSISLFCTCSPPALYFAHVLLNLSILNMFSSISLFWTCSPPSLYFAHVLLNLSILNMFSSISLFCICSPQPLYFAHVLLNLSILHMFSSASARWAAALCSSAWLGLLFSSWQIDCYSGNLSDGEARVCSALFDPWFSFCFLRLLSKSLSGKRATVNLWTLTFGDLL